MSGGPNLTLQEVNEAARLIQAEVHPEANIIFGVILDPELESEVRITLIATGFAQSLVVPKNEDLRRLLKRTEDEGELDIPTFIRSPFAVRHTAAAPLMGTAPVHARVVQPSLYSRFPR